jgi:hypothetical protein
MVSERRARGELHLFRSWDPKAHVPMSVRGDRAAGHHPLCGIDHLVDQILGVRRCGSEGFSILSPAA